MLNLDGRPHWAKRFGPNSDTLQKMYPYWQDFLKVKDIFDPHNLFGNSYTDRIFGKIYDN